jgi:L-ascorbate metabolism protein UlaG (beta-lactamase superfamily)
MEITYYGRSCMRIRGREATIAFDPYTSIVGPTGRGMTADIVTLSHPDDAPLSRVKGRLAPRDGRTPIATSLDAAIVLEGPGEYEVKSVLITGVRSYRDAHRGPAARHNTIFCAEIDGVHVVHLGDYAEGLGNEQLKELPGSDVVLVPVGGGLSVNAAAALISQLGPKIVIPMPIGDDPAKSAAAIKAFCKEEGLSAPPPPQPKIAVTISSLPEETTTLVLEARGDAA